MTKASVILEEDQAWKLKQVCLIERVSQQKLLLKMVCDFLYEYQQSHEIPPCPFIKKKEE